MGIWTDVVTTFEPLHYLPRWREWGIPHGFTTNHQWPEHQHVKQVHGAVILPSNLSQSSAVPATSPADGLISTSSKERVGIKTADCLPVLMVGRHCHLAIHAGWRGLGAGILVEALAVAKSHGEIPKDIYVGLGPCISMERFEVGPEVPPIFSEAAEQLQLGPLAEEVLAPGIGDRWHIDLAGFALLQLAALGISRARLDVLRSCTFANPDVWPSYRREAQQGRIVSWVAAAPSSLFNQS